MINFQGFFVGRGRKHVNHERGSRWNQVSAYTDGADLSKSPVIRKVGIVYHKEKHNDLIP